MMPRVFGYRNAAYRGPIAFVALWSTFWLGMTILQWTTPHIKANGHLAGPEEARLDRFGFLTMGIVVAIGGAVAFLYSQNCRIEISNGEIQWFDFRGRLRVQGSLDSVKMLARGATRNARYEFETDGGKISFSRLISRRGELLRILSGCDTSARMPKADTNHPLR